MQTDICGVAYSKYANNVRREVLDKMLPLAGINGIGIKFSTYDTTGFSGSVVMGTSTKPTYLSFSLITWGKHIGDWMLRAYYYSFIIPHKRIFDTTWWTSFPELLKKRDEQMKKGKASRIAAKVRSEEWAVSAIASLDLVGVRAIMTKIDGKPAVCVYGEDNAKLMFTCGRDTLKQVLDLAETSAEVLKLTFGKEIEEQEAKEEL